MLECDVFEGRKIGQLKNVKRKTDFDKKRNEGGSKNSKAGSVSGKQWLKLPL